MDWAGCLQSAQSAGLLLPHPGISSSIPGSPAASRDRGMLCSFSGNAQTKPCLGTCAPGAFGFFPSPAVGNDTCAVIDHQARFGKGFLGRGSILISIGMGEMEPCTKISQGRHQPLPQAGKPQPCPIPLPLEY